MRHYEWLDTDLLELAGPGDDIGADAPVGDGHHALIMGNPWDAAGVIEGPLEDLLDYLRRAVALLENARCAACGSDKAQRPGGEERAEPPGA